VPVNFHRYALCCASAEEIAAKAYKYAREKSAKRNIKNHPHILAQKIHHVNGLRPWDIVQVLYKMRRVIANGEVVVIPAKAGIQSLRQPLWMPDYGAPA
jgi:hypothetical protein